MQGLMLDCQPGVAGNEERFSAPPEGKRVLTLVPNTLVPRMVWKRDAELLGEWQALQHSFTGWFREGGPRSFVAGVGGGQVRLGSDWTPKIPCNFGPTGRTHLKGCPGGQN